MRKTEMRNNPIKFRYGELFAGAGGLALGAMRPHLYYGDKQYNIVHSWASDYDADSCETYRNNITKESSDTVFCEDVRQLDFNKLSQIDIFAYGFPCNDFSVVGEQRGFEGKYGPLYSFGVKVLNKFKPKVFVAENVGGLASSNEGRAFRKIIEDLSQSGNGYEITTHLYRAEEYGIPQTRHRIILVGIDKTLGLQFRVPAPSHVNAYVTVKEALENPPIPFTAFNHEIKRQSEMVTERLKFIAPGENAWNADLPEHLQLKVKKARLSQIYKRLDPDKPSYTITGSGGGGTHGYHYAEPRALTNRERARIQTFPDNFEFAGSMESVRKQIGMAVPPLLSEVIFTAILKTLAGIDYKSIEPNMFIDFHPQLL